MLRSLLPGGGRRAASMSWTDYLGLLQEFGFNGHRYVAPGGSFEKLTALQGQANPIVAAAIHARVSVFSEVSLLWQPMSGGRPGRLFGNQDLAILEEPWAQATTGDLLARMLMDADLFGNSYWHRRGDSLVRLDPTRVMVITGSVSDQLTGKPYGQQLLSYAFVDEQGSELAIFEPAEVVHFKPIPDPDNAFRGRTWLSTVLKDVQADTQLSDYKTSYLKNAATPNLVVSFDPSITREAFETFTQKMDATHQGVENAFKTLYLGGGADVKVVGSNFEQLAIKATQGAGETRIAAAAGVPAPYLGISEGMQGSALTTGNYQAARRRYADGTIRPLWRSAAGALQVVLPRPQASRLWYDDRDVAFLQEDVKDAADIRMADAATIRQLVDGGFDPDSVVEAVNTGDMSLLTHSGKLSVQLQDTA